MINPVPPKGGEFIKRLAKSFPERKFTVVEGWWDTSTAFIDLANVRYVPRTYDMNKIYSAHQVLLVPSVVEDAFPRVIIEAGLTGLPSVGSDRGGIPEAIADGGVVLPPDDLHAWSEAIDMLDDTTVTDYSARARRNALRFVRSCVEELFKWGVIAT
jgi:glycosyltransferase involved in cell wall biosynthesis